MERTSQRMHLRPQRGNGFAPGVMCMKGGIYAEDRCPICGKGMKDNGRNAIACPEHPAQRGSKLVVRFGRNVRRRFTNYDEASRFLNGLRYKTDEGSYDERDYQSGNPLAFDRLVEKFIRIKELEVKRGFIAVGTFKHIKYDLGKATLFFTNTNVKYINYSDLQLFLYGMEEVKPKTIANIRTNMRAFYNWLVATKEIAPEDVPKFPEFEAEIGWRKTIDKATQEQILEVIREDTAHSPRVYFAFRWLTTYTAIRPGEILTILEEDIDIENGFVLVHHHKTKRHTKGPRMVPLLDEDIELIKTLPRGVRKLPFFRHDTSVKGMPPNTPFGNRLLRKVWKRACAKLGITGVDLYGGTRHSTQQYYRQHMSAEDCMRLSMHTTSKAGQRYLQVQRNELVKGYQLARVQAAKNKVVQILKPEEEPKA